ncbi:MAG: ATP-binding protein, partial [Chloroflexota bacterium]|nr:ATP-binding protein [Chloroflexota bacterium]
LWELNRYEDFLEARRLLISNAINDRMGELITTLEPAQTYSVEEMLTGENAALEYKSSMRWDMRRECVNKDLQKVIAKTIAGFLNSEGGFLFIGVADDCTVLGIDYDLQTLRRKDLDGYEQTLQQILGNSLGYEYSEYWDVSFEEVEDKFVCVVQVDPSPEPVYLNYKGDKEFYKRVGNTTSPLDIQSANEYIGMHWTV